MRIAVLLSGGVDSSTALMDLKRQGQNDLVAYYLKIWLEDDTAFLGSCPWEEDLAFAQAVCDQAGVELRVVPLQLEYYDKVVAYALEELRAGRTPSPDIFCNQRIKFGAFYERMAESGDSFGKVATGHYARVDWVPSAFPGTAGDPAGGECGLDPLDPAAGQGVGRWRLLRAPDPVKDQTYFLSQLSQEQIGRIIFPVGAFVKNRVRELAREYGIPNQDRPDSQGICFLGKIRYPDFIRHYLGEREGPIVERESGKELGRHQGYWFHTIGQRTGLGLGNGPWYVSAKDCRRNVVYVSHGNHAEETGRSTFSAGALNWLTGRAPTAGELAVWNHSGRLCLKLRHGPQITACRLEWRDGGADADGPVLAVNLETADRGLAAGQFAVFYLGEECLGSGKILEAEDGQLESLWACHQEWAARAAAEAAESMAARRARRQAKRELYGHRPGREAPQSGTALGINPVGTNPEAGPGAAGQGRDGAGDAVVSGPMPGTKP
jgi:tRNA-specific 2-thiouridylase